MLFDVLIFVLLLILISSAEARPGRGTGLDRFW